MRTWWCWMAAWAVLAACGTNGGGPDAGHAGDAIAIPDLGPKDSGPKDSGAVGPDASAADAILADAHAPDVVGLDVEASPLDAEAMDALAPDAFEADALAPDAVEPDAFEPDAFALDAAPSAPDAAPSDAGFPSWTPTTTIGAPSARAGHAAVWTGTEMIIWGGSACCPTVDATDHARYSPALDRWTPISNVGAPSRRADPSVVWTGREMIVWGGFALGAAQPYLDDGARYDPATDTWGPMSTAFPAPVGRAGAMAVWTGAEMIVWGGAVRPGGPPASGGAYDPATDRWRMLSSANTPGPRVGSVSVWTGREMIVWGGDDGFGPRNDGAAYDPALDRWRTIASHRGVAPRTHTSGVWTGTEMIVWGGTDGTLAPRLDSGGRYDPVADRWTLTTTSFGIESRLAHRAVWLSDRMVIWGGEHFTGLAYIDQLDGGIYDPVSDAWTRLARPPFPLATYSHSFVAGDGFAIAWGGSSRSLNQTNQGAVLRIAP